MDGEDFGRMAYLVLLLAAVGGWVIVEYRQRMGQALRTAAAWGLIFIGVMAGYGLWQDIRTDITPSQLVTADGTLELPRAEDGHFYATLEVDGQTLRMMVDTGASNMVLSNADADRLGINQDELMFLGQAQTANGMVRTARVTLGRVDFGPFSDSDVSAWVTDGEMDLSLLGMDYLSRYQITISGNTMLLSR